MVLALQAFWCVAALELMIWLLPSLRIRRLVAAILFPLVIVSAALLLGVHLALPTALLALASLYRALNMLRLIRGRIDAHYLRRVTLATSLWIIFAQSVLMVSWLVADRMHWTLSVATPVLVGANLAVAMLLLASTIRHLRTTQAPAITTGATSDSSLPSLTVAIPARNETDDLDACLQSLLASDYPKLEILVLDDCSQNKHTPEIIRSYAHAGVRFLQGAVPADNWLAKNFACQQLYDAASGDLILFCGVDVRVSPQSLRLAVMALQQKHKSMISFIPQNIVPPITAPQGTTMLQPMRYAWELALPRRFFRRPPVLSTCWLVTRELLATAGGFGAVSRSVVPESYFARQALVHDGYSFMQGAGLGIESNKSLHEQRSTSVRVQYPRVHRRIELVLFLSVAELALILTPYLIVLHAVVGGGAHFETWIAAASVLVLTATYALVVTLTYSRLLLRSLVLLPFAVVLDVTMLHYSMIRYEFFTVIWKDRNVCIPVMRVTDGTASVQLASAPASADSVR